MLPLQRGDGAVEVARAGASNRSIIRHVASIAGRAGDEASRSARRCR
jgi:hypothetical protein